MIVNWIECPPEIRAAVEPYLTRWIALLPTWCQRFEVRYEADMDATMAMHVNHRNRWAQLRVTGQWLDEPDGERENAVVHELLHVGLEPCFAAARRIMEDLTQERDTTRALADSMLTDALECTVEDLARAVLRVREQTEGPNVSRQMIRRVADA
jgi:hypothetical protein